MLTTDEVRHVAMLARLGLTDDEVELMRVQMLQLLDYVDILQQVDTSHIAPTAQMLTRSNVLRPDEARPSLATEDILLNAPGAEEGFFKVPPVMEDARNAPDGTEE